MKNKLSFFDSHAHLSLFAKEELDPLIERAKKANVEKIVNVCLDPNALEEGMLLHQKYPWIYSAAATSPHDALEGKNFFSHFATAAKEKKLVALGETGLDYHYHAKTKDAQIELLIQYFQLALCCNLPVILHCREAFQDLFAIAKESFPSSRAVLHCFTGTKEEAEKALDLGWMLSFSGIVTFKKSEHLRRVASYTPLEKIMIETDAPYLAPETHRGKKNEPSFVPLVAQTIAECRKSSIEKIASSTRENAIRFFSLD